MDKNDVFEFDAPKTFTNLYEMANAEDDGADKFFDLIAEKMGGAKSEPSLEVIKQESLFDEDDEENKENFAPDDVFDQHNLNSIAHQLIRSAKKPRTSKLHNRHSITVEGIEVELPRVKHHAMITRLDELENTPKFDLRSRSVVKSEYKYEQVKPGSNVLKPRSTVCLFSSNDMNNLSSTFNNGDNINEIKQSRKDHEDISGRNLPNINFNSQNPLSSIKVSTKTQSIKILNSHDGVQVVENKELGHGGIKVQEKQLHTVPKPFSFESRKSYAIAKSSTKIPQQWMFKARPATVLKKKPFVPKHEKKYTEPKNVQLNTERRAKEWMVFEQELKEKFSHYEEMAKKRQEESKKEEIRALKNSRKQTVHKPIPIKKYKPILIKKSEKPVTVPHSPRFSIRPNRGCINTVCE
ncbi:uncharacterized protein LOC126904460 isoform X2 [Daktulosphaira vitifoliae]|uniref:uncharacterized protein LOC126904460 isoform X2 n=1 Tax=Daktulosphaira vitifoliae TaxID=58002 RepID=UPI0021A99785|nr:uncharacterized protein LOC126904460 isoform X2 [Daktulosphaira vitifoliae]